VPASSHPGGQAELARALNISRPVISNYISLLSLAPELQRALVDKRVNYKEARALADLPRERQLEIAQPFLSGALSSVHVERVVRRAKAYPDLPVESLLSAVVVPPQPTREAESAQEPPVPAVAPVPCVEDVAAAALRLAGELDMLDAAGVNGIERLRVQSAVRRLESRLSKWR
jgi:hypothetical protein